MNHVEEQLSDFHFGVLTVQERRKIELHLSLCSACLLSYFEFKADVECEEVAPPDALRQSLRLKVSEAVKARAPKPPRWHRPAAYAFAFAALWLASLSVQTVASGPGAAPRSAGAR